MKVGRRHIRINMYTKSIWSAASSILVGRIINSRGSRDRERWFPLTARAWVVCKLLATPKIKNTSVLAY